MYDKGVGGNTGSYPSFPLCRSRVGPVLFSIFSRDGTSTRRLLRRCCRVFGRLRASSRDNGHVTRLGGVVSATSGGGGGLLRLIASNDVAGAGFGGVATTYSQSVSRTRRRLGRVRGRRVSGRRCGQRVSRIHAHLRTTVGRTSSNVVSPAFIARCVSGVFTASADSSAIGLRVGLFANGGARG